MTCKIYDFVTNLQMYFEKKKKKLVSRNKNQDQVWAVEWVKKVVNAKRTTNF